MSPADDQPPASLSLGQRIRARREAAGLTQEKLATHCGVSRAAVAQWEAGVTRPSLDNLVKAADTLGVWLSWLTVGDQSLPDTANPFAAITRQGIPVIDLARAGGWSPKQAAATNDVPRIAGDPDHSPQAFALAIGDESMTPDFRAGDKIIVDPEVAPQPGDFVIAKLDRDAESVFRKFRPRGEDGKGGAMVELVPLNPDWPTVTIGGEAPGRIVGTLVEHRRYRHRP